MIAAPAAWQGLQWGQPMVLFALPLALLALLPLVRRRPPAQPPRSRLALLHPDLQGLATVATPAPAGRIVVPVLLRTVALALWIVALAQPQRPGGWLQPAPLGRDIVVLLDTSLTMSLHDLEWNGRPASRLAVAQQVFAGFARARAGDRFALLTFGKQAATLLPPTFDQQAAGAMGELLSVGALGNDTALGDAIALALRQVRARHGLHPIVILYSDGGQSNAGTISPADAVAMARQVGVRIYTVEVGATPDAGTTYRVPAYAGDQPDMRLIARATGGRFFFAARPGAQRAAIDAIGRLNPRLHPPPRRRAVLPLYAAPLLLGIGLWLLAPLAGGVVARRRPR